MGDPYRPKKGHTYCGRCGQSLRRLMLLALLSDFGAKTSRKADRCDDGDEHDFMEDELPITPIVGFSGLYRERVR